MWWSLRERTKLMFTIGTRASQLFSLRASRRGPLVLSAGVSFVIVVVFGYDLVCSVVAGGAQNIAGYYWCFALRWCIAFLAACASKSSDSKGDWWRCCVLRGRRRGPENRWIPIVFCCSLVHCFLGCLCWEIANSSDDWWRFCVLRGRRWGPENRWIPGVFCSSLVDCFLGGLCYSGRPTLRIGF